MRYVAFLRGVNVGGNAKVEMTRLKKAFEDVGSTEVATYINSGNVVFADTRNVKELEPIIEAAIFTEFGFTVPTILRTKMQIESIIVTVPTTWTNDASQRTDVMFLWDDVDNETVLQKLQYDPTIETIQYVPGAIVWNIPREHVMKGGGVKLIKSELYKKMTIRNINTVRKLNDLL